LFVSKRVYKSLSQMHETRNAELASQVPFAQPRSMQHHTDRPKPVGTYYSSELLPYTPDLEGPRGDN